MKSGTFKLGDFILQSGEILRDAVLSYETHGSLDETKSNVIVYPTWYSGNHEDVRQAIGSGRALDPEKYFIIVPDMFGNGFSTSPSHQEYANDRSQFPAITPYDNVEAQHRLLTEHFSITKIKLFVGFSMSAQQAFHWGALYPEYVSAIAPICGSSVTSTHNWLFLESLKKALTTDPLFNEGNYETAPETGLRAFSTIYAGWAFSKEFYRERLHLSWLGEDFKDTAEFLDAWHSLFTPKNDANNLLAMLDTWQRADVSKHSKFEGNLTKALSSITCPAIVMPGRTDMYFPPEDNAFEVSKMPNAELRIIESVYGHGAGGPGFSNDEDDAFIDQALFELLR